MYGFNRSSEESDVFFSLCLDNGGVVVKSKPCFERASRFSSNDATPLIVKVIQQLLLMIEQ